MQSLIDYFGFRFDYTREMLIMGLILARTLPMVFLAPFMAGQQTPPEIRMGMGVFFTLLLWPIVSQSMGSIPIHAFAFLLLMLKEILVGFALGFAASLIFSAMETAGRFIDTTRGAAMSEVLVPTSRSRATPIGTMYNQLLMVFFVCLGGHRIFIDTFFNSFTTIPINGMIDMTPGMSPLSLHLIRMTGDVLGIALIMSAPAMAATFITDLVFGILNRVAPQLNAYFMSMPVKAMAALILVLVSLPPFMNRLDYYSGQMLVSCKKVVELFQPQPSGRPPLLPQPQQGKPHRPGQAE